MTTKLEEVLAEEWHQDVVHVDAYVAGTNCPSISTAIFHSEYTEHDVPVAGPLDETRAAVAVLGKRALPLLIKHEWVGHGCPECMGAEPAWLDAPASELEKFTQKALGMIVPGGVHRGHKPDCEWGRIVEEARRLG